jgi:dolichyl-phosphate-mannose-protein mannosyltransferase
MSFIDRLTVINAVDTRPMTKILQKVVRWQYFYLSLICAISVILHSIIITHPADLVFDESYYVVEARGIMAGFGPLLTEHPPLAKLFIIIGIRLFGDGPVGWRLFPVLFGTASIVLFYFICGSLKMSRKGQLIATFLFSFENLVFLQSGLAMLDVYSVTIMLGAFLLYIRNKYMAGGIAFGLSALAKLPSLLALPGIFIHWYFSRRGKVLPLMVMALSAVISFFVVLPIAYFALSHTMVSPIQLVQNLLVGTRSVTFATGLHPGAARPWEWLTGISGVYFYSYDPQYLSVITPTIWILIIPSTLYMLYKAVKGNEASLFAVSWFGSIMLLWTIMTLLTNRMTFLSYIYPGIGAICIGIAMALSDLWDYGKSMTTGIKHKVLVAIVPAFLVIHMALFLSLSPLFPLLTKWFPPIL